MTDATHTGAEGTPGFGAAALFLGAIALGAVLGLGAPVVRQGMSAGIDPTLLILVGLLFFEVRLRTVVEGLGNLRFMGVAWVANFIIVPLIALAVASLFLSGQPLLYTGLLIYFLAPCTDWFLGFTRMARGNTALGAALMPINMVTQLLLLPVWLWLFTRHTGVVDFATIPETMWQWFVLPFLVAQALRWSLGAALSQAAFNRLSHVVSGMVPWVTAALILQLFALHTPVMAAHLEVLGLVVLAIFVFFAATYLMAEGLARVFDLPYPEQALLAMTTAARNAPLMLAVTAVAIPDQPIIYAALVIGMLVEFPHLTGLKQVLLAKAARARIL
ncbi:MAG: arsenic resistance protein [Pseudomonadota bacterium]